ncbi:MAG: hypothetical protein EBZ36_03185 [Acidobacteria bacterium]|nr:hypothetical protein [Acidobacteriota bacterium]
MLKFALTLLLLALPLPASGAEYKVESIGALTESKVPAGLRGALESRGLRVLDEKGATVCEIWLRKEIPSASEEVAGAVFSKIGEGTLTGVIHFPANAGDFRGQGLKAGWYTLRYGLILQDGNHLGVSPTRDFFVICPLTEDADPEKRLSFDEMMKLSRGASGTGHPSCWSLAPASDPANLPHIVRNEHEHVVIEFNLPTKGGPIAVGMVVVGKTEG